MSSSPAPVDKTDAGNKRRSGRVTRKPDLYTEPLTTSSKRKRDVAEDENGDQDSDQEDSESEEESEPDEEELREQRTKARKPKAAAPKKPAAKRSKTNGISVALPVRAAGKKGRTKKAKGVDEATAEEAGGLYGWFSLGPFDCTLSNMNLQPTFLPEARRWKRLLPNGSNPLANTNHAPWLTWSTLC